MTSHCCQEVQPRDHSHQLLNHIVDCVAAREPQALYAEYPVSLTSYEDGFMRVTYGKLANAIDCMAWWLVDTLGQGHNFEPLAYIGPNDLTYPALILGAIKAGYTTLLLSPRNSRAAQLHLLEATNCKIFLTSEQPTPPITAVVNSLDASYRVLKVPSVDELLREHCKPFLYNVPFEEGCQTPFTIMHTSGSTGMPKPITWPQSFVPAYAKQLQLDPPPKYKSTDKLYEANRIFVVFPPFHPSEFHTLYARIQQPDLHSNGRQAAYVAHAIVNAITNQTTIIFPLKGAIASAHSLSEIVRRTKVDAALIVPAIVEEMSRSPVVLENIASNVETLVYSGGDVPQGCGDIVASSIPIVNFYGSTEGASLALIHPESGLDKKEWKYLSLHPDAGAEFRHHADDLYELIIVRRPELEKHQQIFTAFPDHQEWPTKDLFRRHPSKPNLWNHCGRADDTVTFITGEKLNPIHMEQHIFSQNPEISGVLVVGSQRFQAGLLVELAKGEEITEDRRKELIERFWPSIEHVNQGCSSHAKIAGTHITFVGPKRPMIRSPKGTIQRAATLSEHASTLDAMYKAADEVRSIGEGEFFNMLDTISALEWLQALVNKQTKHKLTPEDNLFVQGMDSLQSLLLVREIRNLFGLPQLEVSTLYANPTTLSLFKVIQQLKSGDKPSKVSETSPNDISSILSIYSRVIDEIPSSSKPAMKAAKDIFLLTGSTGCLGSYILDVLLSSDAIQQVYCLNRSDSAVIQRKKNASRGLSTDLDDRVIFLTADLSRRFLGLEEKTYNEMLSSVTCIIHNAWSVDFNIPLSSYRPQLQGVVNLVKFAASASRQPSLLYISSISAVSNLKGQEVPEAIVNDHSAPASTGYGASKYVTEHLLSQAAERLSIKTQIARVGQIAGPVLGPGQWNRSEWLPSLIRSSVIVRAIPGSLGANLDNIDWIPVDHLAKVLCELIKSDQPKTLMNEISVQEVPQEEVKVFNVLNPYHTQWSELLPTIIYSLKSLPSQESKSFLQKIPFEVWLHKVQAHFEDRDRAANAGEDLEATLEANPAVKLLNFYEEARTQPLRVWQTDNARNSSRALSGLLPMRPEWMQKWIQAWFSEPFSDPQAWRHSF